MTVFSTKMANGDLQMAQASMLHPIVKPWPFRDGG
jgi:hypothetical protein